MSVDVLSHVRLKTVVVLILCWAATTVSAADLNVMRITPTGNDVPAGRQVVIEFDRDVVPLGRMRRSADELPVDIHPALACDWRWLNARALACQLAEDAALRPSTVYRVRVAPKLIALDGKRLEREVTHTFITERADVVNVLFEAWVAPDRPMLRVVFNQPVYAESVRKHMFMRRVQQPHTRIAVKVSRYAATAGQPGAANDLSDLWLVEPVAPLGTASSAALVLEPGLRSAMGLQESVAARVVTRVDTFPEFSFLGVRCQSVVHDDWVLWGHTGDAPADAACDPLGSVALVFSSPVMAEHAAHSVRFEPGLAGDREDYNPWANQNSYSRLQYPHNPEAQYVISVPERLPANRSIRLKIASPGLVDEFGRTLATSVDMTFTTAHRRPALTLPHRASVLEQNTDTEVPVYVTNLDRVSIEFKSLTAERETSGFHHIEVPHVEDVAFALPLQAREMLNGQSGVLSGVLHAEPASVPPTTFFAQVTPFQVHAKMGHFSSLVWVTDLATGQPIEGASVSIYRDEYAQLSIDAGVMQRAVLTDEYGVGRLPGLAKLDPALEYINRWTRDATRLFAKVQKGEDIALLPLDSSFSMAAKGVANYHRARHGHIRAWGTTAQGVYKAGDTLQYKIIVRNQDSEHLTSPPRSTYALRIVDPQGNGVFERKDIALSRFGSFDGEFAIAQNAPVGWYQFELKASFAEQSWYPMRVLVSDFTPSPFKVTLDLSGHQFTSNDALEMTTRAVLHAGGAYPNAPARVSLRLRETEFSSDHALAKGFTFANLESPHADWRTLLQSDAMLDDDGESITRYELEDTGVSFGRLQVETTVRDDRGKSVARLANADFVGRDRFIGLRHTRWLYGEDETAVIEYLVVDVDGAPVAGAEVDIVVAHEQLKAARVKGSGDVYETKYERIWVEAARCQDQSRSEVMRCEFAPQAAGEYRVTASVSDTLSRVHTASLGAWVVGQGEVLWEQGDDAALQLIGEQPRFKVGDTARYLVRNPYPGALALVTIERYGILTSWVERLDTSTPVIEFPIDAAYSPGVYLSVLVASPRVEQPLGDGNVDLGKPAVRLGYAKLPVVDPYNQIDVDVQTDAQTYEPRQTVNVTLSATAEHAVVSEPVELAVVVLDESVFDLIADGKTYFDPYAGFYALEALDVGNFNLSKRLVGLQNFAKKGADVGGDGGGSESSARNLFKYVTYWNPSLMTDAHGEARVSFTVPDNLTGWRILVMATTRAREMGLGDASFAVNKATQIRPVMPNQVTQGDQFTAGFSVMNRTDETRDLEVMLQATGAVTSGMARTITRTRLAAFERKTIWLPVQTIGHGLIAFSARAGDALDTDALEHGVTVNRRRPLETAASFASLSRGQARIPVAFPQKMHTDTGSISVIAAPSVIGNIDGAFRYMRDYPYACWEQRLSTATMAARYTAMKPYLPADLIWPESDALPAETLAQASVFQAPNGGMSYWVARDDYVSPYLSAFTSLAFAWLRETGYAVPEAVASKLATYLDAVLKKEDLPDFYDRGMVATVRAVALAALAKDGRLERDTLQRYASHMPYMSAFGKTQYLQAALHIGATSRARETLDALLANTQMNAGKLSVNVRSSDGYRRLLSTPLRANCALLEALVVIEGSAMDAPELLDTALQLVRTITQGRGSRSHWENTQENLFCMSALAAFAQTYEAVAPNMHVQVRLDEEALGRAQFDDPRDTAVTFARPVSPSDPGRQRMLTIEHAGTGRLYYSTRFQYSPSDEDVLRANAGMDIRREYSVVRKGGRVMLTAPMTIARGEVVRVDLFLSVPRAGHFVVVDDGVPGGLEPVNRDLATASILDSGDLDIGAAQGSRFHQFDDWRGFATSYDGFYHKELRHDSVRFFADYIEPGNYVLSYSAQAIATGVFAASAVHAQEMYDVDVFGRGLPSVIEVTEE